MAKIIIRMRNLATPQRVFTQMANERTFPTWARKKKLDACRAAAEIARRERAK